MKINAKNIPTELRNKNHLIIYKLGSEGLGVVVQDYYYGEVVRYCVSVGGFLHKDQYVDTNKYNPITKISTLPEPYKKIASFYLGLSGVDKIFGENETPFKEILQENPKFKWEIPLWGILTGERVDLGNDDREQDVWDIIEDRETQEIEIFGEDTMKPYTQYLPYPEGKARISKKEFYLLMQIYYGVYGEKNYYNALKSYEQEGKYAEIEKLYELYGTGKEEQLDWERLRNDIYEKRYSYNEELLNEYLMMKLIEKDVSGVFEGLEITKIYDEKWSDEDKLLNLPEIQELFGENVIIED